MCLRSVITLCPMGRDSTISLVIEFLIPVVHTSRGGRMRNVRPSFL
ncbi:hypothetical protein CSUI_006799 [Cystoisospora suis]|uniref:Uncharacterized protein n=1 Tax=Cystoisospora suis TaxID=483139 RepID=A0A2C6KST5_9APIC|nr:hypothetical protein CSUI_006799 [Cystoisospora suis]